MITSQLPVNCWHEVIGDKTIPAAIPGRVVMMHTELNSVENL